jgi:hypothetical protein
MKKTYILDTNVLLHDPQALFRFEDNDLVIPITVIEEIDRFKKDQSEIGRNARQISRLLDGFRKQAHLVEGVPLEKGGVLKVVIFTEEAFKRLPPELRVDQGDNRILAVALKMKEDSPLSRRFRHQGHQPADQGRRRRPPWRRITSRTRCRSTNSIRAPPSSWWKKRRSTGFTARGIWRRPENSCRTSTLLWSNRQPFPYRPLPLPVDPAASVPLIRTQGGDMGNPFPQP